MEHPPDFSKKKSSPLFKGELEVPTNKGARGV